MDLVILERSLKLIENIYNESMYGDKDIFRIKDLIHSLDTNHWKNKKWSADLFRRLYESEGGTFIVLGGWYGLLGYQIRKAFPEETYHIISSDLDPKCEKIGYKLFYDSQIKFETMDMKDAINMDVDAIFCTSVEHVDPKILENIIKKKKEKTWLILQSNNYHDIPSHINTHKSLNDFKNWCENLFEIDFKGEMNNGEWNRYMVMGRGKPLPIDWR